MTLAILSVVLIGNYSIKGPFWALATGTLSPATAAAGIAGINTLSHIGTSGAVWLLGVIKEATGSFPIGLDTAGGASDRRHHRGAVDQQAGNASRHRRRKPRALNAISVIRQTPTALLYQGMKMAAQSKTKLPATLIPGDGIGPEIVKSAVEILDALGSPFEWEIRQGGLAAIEESHDPLPQSTLDSIRRTRLALKGPLTTPVGGGFRSINVRLREEFGLYANLRPVRSMVPGGRFDDIDIVLVRENLGGLYVAFEHYIPIGDDPHAVAISTGVNTREGSRKIIEFAFDYALKNGRKKVTVVHKANVLKALTGVFLEVGHEVAKKYEGRIQMDDRIVDATAMQLVMNPWQFDVIVTTNLFGDILSDQLAGLVGGLGMAPGANIGPDAAIFEAVHGSAPDIAGKGIANPLALLLAVGLMLEHIEQPDLANRLRAAIDQVLRKDGVRTPDLGGKASTGDFTQSIIRRLGG